MATKSLSFKRRVFIFVVGLLECSIFGGMVFGWPQLVFVLKQEGIYSGLCGAEAVQHNASCLESAGADSSVKLNTSEAKFGHPSTSEESSDSQAERWKKWKEDKCYDVLQPNDTDVPCSSSMDVTETCLAQDKQFAFVFSVGVVMYALPSVVIGFILHHAGLWVARLIGSSMLILSFILFALLNTEREQLLLPALMLLSIGGNQLRLCAVQFGDLFPQRRATALNLLMGSYSLSSSVFFLFQMVTNAGLPKSVVCWALVAVSSASALATFTMPRQHVSHAMADDSTVASKNQDEKLHSPVTVSLKLSLISVSSALHSYWLFTALFVVNSYQQIFNVWITTSSCTTADEQHYTMLFSFCGLVGAAVAPVLGHMTDSIVRRTKRRAKDAFMLRVEEVCSHFLPLLITTFFLLILFSSQLVFRSAAIYLSLVGLVVCRSCVFSTSTAFLRARFPVEHLDRLMGIYNTVIGMMVWSVYPFFTWQMHNYYAATITGLCFVILNASYPLHLLFKESIRRALLELPQPKAIQTDSLLHRAPARLMNNNV